MEAKANDNKRSRDESLEFPEAKRFREILDGDDFDSGAVDGLDDVIKSLEEEITCAEPAQQLNLGYLLGASNDELGLPPAVGTSPASSYDGGGDVNEIVGDEVETVTFDPIWDFEGDLVTAFNNNGVMFDGVLFDYFDAGYEQLDSEDSLWRADCLPWI